MASPEDVFSWWILARLLAPSREPQKGPHTRGIRRLLHDRDSQCAPFRNNVRSTTLPMPCDPPRSSFGTGRKVEQVLFPGTLPASHLPAHLGSLRRRLRTDCHRGLQSDRFFHLGTSRAGMALSMNLSNCGTVKDAYPCSGV